MGSSSRLNLLIAVVVACALMAGGAVYWLSHRKPSSLKARVSYTIGSQFGKSLNSQNLDLDPSVVARGLKDSLRSQASPLTEQEMEAAMVQFNDNRRKQQKEEADRNKISADSFLAQNRIAPGVKTTPSGLQYKVVREGAGRSPKGDDVVVVNYTASLTDGKAFDSTYKRGTPAQFPLKGVMPGWSEGLQLMKKGGKSIIYVPPHLGYGAQARQNIPANAVLVFDVELMDVKSAPAAKK